MPTVTCLPNVQKWLKPGGRLLIRDYCCGEGEISAGVKEWAGERSWTLHTVKRYGEVTNIVDMPPGSLFLQAGFTIL